MPKVIPVIRGFFSSNIADLEHYRPPKSDDVSFPLQISIGEDGASGSDDFQVRIVGLGAVKRFVGHKTCLSGRHVILVAHYDWPAIKAFIEALVAQCEGDSWSEVTGKLARHFRWEYEDYKAEN